ncbi:hypothetical protein [Geminocystis herdmanii]|uniref:hypothetical protein n=1 Tax=Geminocystis herdmanii TaxID=669359 RepID=UPI00034B3DEA|nr:hypothetical protein [Geminocystis herdmanii]
MSINFFDERCQSKTSKLKFGICDDSSLPQAPAYIDSDIANEQTKWIAIVENINAIEITFTAIDNCIEIRKANGKMDNRCDGMLTYQNNIIFVELKERDYQNKVWIDKGDKQLRTTISNFVTNHNLADYKSKKAYIANRKKPYFQYSHKQQMQKFKNDTGFLLVIEQKI